MKIIQTTDHRTDSFSLKASDTQMVWTDSEYEIIIVITVNIIKTKTISTVIITIIIN